MHAAQLSRGSSRNSLRQLAHRARALIGQLRNLLRLFRLGCFLLRFCAAVTNLVHLALRVNQRGRNTASLGREARGGVEIHNVEDVRALRRVRYLDQRRNPSLGGRGLNLLAHRLDRRLVLENDLLALHSRRDFRKPVVAKDHVKCALDHRRGVIRFQPAEHGPDLAQKLLLALDDLGRGHRRPIYRQIEDIAIERRENLTARVVLHIARYRQVAAHFEREERIAADRRRPMKAAVLQRPFTVGFSGATDFNYVGDTAATFVEAALRAPEGAHVFNLHGESVEVQHILDTIARFEPEGARGLSVNGPALPIPPALESSALGRTLPGLPHTRLEDGIGETLRRFRELAEAGRLDTRDLD